MNESEQLRELASKHLGKAGDGSLVKAYVTPKEHDKALLVPLPRSLNRSKSNIDNTDFVGYEVWHAYEMSFIGPNGMPVTGVLKIMYLASSKSMVESKSFKLYLNSFDLEKFSSKEEVEQVIQDDLSEAVGGSFTATLHIAHEARFKTNPVDTGLFNNVDDNRYNVTEYKENPELLQEDIVPGMPGTFMTFHTANLRSNCEITNQKDTGNCYILINGTSAPTLESLTKYIISFRDSQHFHENVTEIIYSTLLEKYKPEELLVANIYNRRGGLDIHSVRASSVNLLESVLPRYENTDVLFKKTAQQ